MTTLIATLRQLIQDETSPYTLSDDTVEDVLDRHSQRVLRHRLEPAYADNDGLCYWFYALATHWEDRDSAIALKDGEGNELPVAESDLSSGMWRLTTGQSGDVYLYSGYTYDVYGAASECCNLMIARIKDEYTFSSDEGSFNRSQRVDHLQKLFDSFASSRRVYALGAAE